MGVNQSEMTPRHIIIATRMLMVLWLRKYGLEVVVSCFSMRRRRNRGGTEESQHNVMNKEGIGCSACSLSIEVSFHMQTITA